LTPHEDSSPDSRIKQQQTRGQSGQSEELLVAVTTPLNKLAVILEITDRITSVLYNNKMTKEMMFINTAFNININPSTTLKRIQWH